MFVRVCACSGFLLVTYLCGGPVTADPSLKHRFDMGEGFFVAKLVFSPDSKVLAVGGGQEPDPSDIRLFSLVDYKLVATLKEHKKRVTCLAFSPDGRTLISGGLDGQCIVWNAISKQIIARLGEPKGSVRALAIGPGGKQVAVSRSDKTVVVWDLASQRTIARLTSNGEIIALEYSPAGQVLAGCGEGGTTIWNAQSGKRERELKGFEPVLALTFSPNGRYLVSASEDGVIRVWDTANWLEYARIEQGKNRPLALAVSPRSQVLAVSCFTGEVILYNLSKELLSPLMKKDIVWSHSGYRVHILLCWFSVNWNLRRSSWWV